MNHPHPLANCPICVATEAMNEDQKAQEKYLARWLNDAIDRWMGRQPRATTSRDPFRFSIDDVLDAHDNMPDRIPSEWRP